MKIESEVKLDFDDVLIVPQPSTVKSRADVNLLVKYQTKYSNKEISCIPIVASNMDTVGVKNVANIFSKNNLLTCIHKFYSEDEIVEILDNNSNVFYSLGMTNFDYQKLMNVSKKIKIENICLDVANAYSSSFIKYCREIREKFPFATIMAGNVATPEGVRILIEEGMVDICKGGVGSGTVCKTRIVAGVGYPQFSLIKECCEIAAEVDGLICSDGGIRYIADFCKAFAAGAHFVMAGGFFAGHDECEGDWELEPNWVDEKNEHGNLVKVQKGYKKKCLKFYGMSSTEAMNKYHNGVAEYRASEGKCVQVPSKGPIQNTVNDILGGLRSCCSYIGSHNLQDMKNNANFIKVNRTHDNFS